MLHFVYLDLYCSSDNATQTCSINFVIQGVSLKDKQATELRRRSEMILLAISEGTRVFVPLKLAMVLHQAYSHTHAATARLRSTLIGSLLRQAHLDRRILI